MRDARALLQRAYCPNSSPNGPRLRRSGLAGVGRSEVHGQLRLLISDVFAGHRGGLFWGVESPAIPARVTELQADPQPGTASTRGPAYGRATPNLRPTPASSIQIAAQTILIVAAQPTAIGPAGYRPRTRCLPGLRRRDAGARTAAAPPTATCAVLVRQLMTKTEASDPIKTSCDADIRIGTVRRRPMTDRSFSARSPAVSTASSRADHRRPPGRLCIHRDTKDPLQRPGVLRAQWHKSHNAHSIAATRVSSIRLQ